MVVNQILKPKSFKNENGNNFDKHDIPPEHNYCFCRK